MVCTTVISNPSRQLFAVLGIDEREDEQNHTKADETQNAVNRLQPGKIVKHGTEQAERERD